MSFKKRNNEIVVSNEPKQEFEWVLRAKKIKQLMNDYISGFCNNVIYLNADKEKWSLQLYNYVYAVAKIQAQMIVGDKVGWNKNDIMGINNNITDEQLWGFLQRQKQQSEKGYIDVSIPTTKIEEWKNNN